MSKIFAISLALLCAGCAAESGPPPVSYPMSYGPRAGHIAWQQFCEQAFSVAQASSLVAARGADGWELAAMYNGVLCYKRPQADFPAAVNTPRPSAYSPQYVPSSRDPGF